MAPALIVAPPVRVTVSVPCATVTRVVATLLSASLTLMAWAPVKVSAVSSFTVWAPGTVFTGAVLAGVTEDEALEAVLVPIELVAVTVKVYAVPLVSPVTLIGEDVPVAVMPLGEEVTV